MTPEIQMTSETQKLFRNFKVVFVSENSAYFGWAVDDTYEICIEPCFSGFYVACYDRECGLCGDKVEVFGDVRSDEFDAMIAAIARGDFGTPMCTTHLLLMEKAVIEAGKLYEKYAAPKQIS